MAGKSPRAKVRLRLDKGTVLLRQFGITSITCTIIDLSESGCQCRFSMAELDEETGLAWKQVLAPGRVLSVELSEPPELRNLIFRDAQVRWVKAGKGGDLDFGMQFSNVDDFQRNTLNQAMMAFAAEKLRSKKMAEALSKTSGKPPPAPPKLPASTEAAISAFTLSSNNAAERAPVQRTPTGSQPPLRTPTGSHQPTRTPTGKHPTIGSHQPTRTPTGKHAPLRDNAEPPMTSTSAGVRPGAANDPSARQKRQNVFMSALFDFCSKDGALWEDGMHQGRTVDFSEGGFKIEGPAPDCCEAEELFAREAYANVIIRSTSEEVKCKCRVCNVEASPNMRGFWLYGMQIIDMEERDRKQLREMYIRAGFQVIRKR